MKLLFCILSCCLSALLAFSQIPNGNFEEWETVDSIESPTQWQTNNFYTGITPIDKINNAISGNYSMKVSSTARDYYSGESWPGYAFVKFIPTEIYPYLTASVRIDSIKNGEVEIRVKQRAADGYFYRIGSWKRSTLTNGSKTIWFPIAYSQLDTLMIDIWAFNQDQVFGGPNQGYSEVVIDNIEFSNTLYSDEAANFPMIEVSPNPTRDFLSVRLDQVISGHSQLRLLDLQGRVRQTHYFLNLSTATLDTKGIPPGVYLLELRKDGLMVKQSKVVVVR